MWLVSISYVAMGYLLRLQWIESLQKDSFLSGLEEIVFLATIGLMIKYWH